MDDKKDTSKRDLIITVVVIICVISLIIYLIVSSLMVKTWSKTESVGGTGGGPFEFKCPDGDYVTHMGLKAGDVVDAVLIQCKDKTKSPIYGGNGGSEYLYMSNTGFNGFNVAGNQLVGNISPLNEFSIKGGKNILKDTKTHKLQCPDGSKVAGIYGRNGSLVDSLGFYCY